MTDAWSELPERAQTLLRLLIDRYTDEGAPIGSRALARMSDLNLSPATVRNVMADLEDLGLVRAPHTSSGRVPTELAYRLFVDSLLVSPSKAPVDARRLERILREAAEDDPQQMADTASQLLSGLTRFAGVVTIPSRARALFRQIDFVSLSPGRVLMVLVTNDGGVQNRIIHPDKPYGQDELTRFANFLNERLNGQSIQALRETLVSELKRTREELEGNLNEAIVLAESAVDAVEDDAGVVVAGQTNLMGIDELGDVERMRRLFNAFAEKRELVSLLDQCELGRGVKIFIGRESGSPSFDECGVVGASYGVDDQVVGVLGVIGPKRMPYDRVISIVDVTSRLLSSALSR
ncbi:MAG: heat-inducible transcription repressor HrcA [Halothiobacillaceae bacterium]|nr:heat-inducible transcription repressor HrcA [Halothiobacillaceae bacterium]HER20156.1 heat-inducible transcription repressor HrcA [Chromatiales bacterium]